MKNPAITADRNFFALSTNPYPGRGLIIGKDETGKSLVQVYWIMGRSENSRNRIFSSDGGRIFTEAADPSKVVDPSLIIYNAMAEVKSFSCGPLFVVSNGSQTDSFVTRAKAEGGLHGVLSGTCYEPDAPNFTPRISGFCLGTLVELSILRKSSWGESCDRSFYEYEKIEPSFGFCLTTYSGDGNPLPAFRGDPLLMPLVGRSTEIAEKYWEALDEANRVSLVVKFIDIESGVSSWNIINKNKKV